LRSEAAALGLRKIERLNIAWRKITAQPTKKSAFAHPEYDSHGASERLHTERQNRAHGGIFLRSQERFTRQRFSE
jgi:hypothetical protein